MIFLLITLCTSPAMDDCQVMTMGQFKDKFACEVAIGRAEEVLGTGPEQNYRMECAVEDME